MLLSLLSFFLLLCTRVLSLDTDSDPGDSNNNDPFIATNADASRATTTNESNSNRYSNENVASRTAPTTTDAPPESKSPNHVIRLAEAIEKTSKIFLQDPELQKIRKQYWEQTFTDIRNLASGSFPARSPTPPRTSILEEQEPEGEKENDNDPVKETSAQSETTTSGSGGSFFSQWKLLLDNTYDPISTFSKSQSSLASPSTPSLPSQKAAVKPRRSTRRFEGFVSWERLLQDWADDIQEYIETAQSEEGNEEYPFSTFGRPTPKNVTSVQLDESSPRLIDEKISDGSVSSTVPSEESKSKTEQAQPDGVTLPIPGPAKPGEAVQPHTNISDKSKRILIVTTASLPWRTGTAVNPLLRAAYLTHGRKAAGGSVTLMLPWLERKEDQERVYGKESFQRPEDQEQFVRSWLRDSAGMQEASEDLKIEWYTAWQNKVENSIYSMGDITALIPDDSVDICILEEPEHLNWYRAPGESWTKKFGHVVGILHTNYFQYAMDQPAALVRAPAMKLLCSWMCRAHCHRVIKLSGTLGNFAPEKELVENVHGVRGTFIDVGTSLREKLQSRGGENDPIFGSTAKPTVYFIGKLLWSKGLGSLMELLKYAEESAELQIKVDMYGGGPDQKAAEARAQKLGLDMPFHGPLDHAELASTHKVFVNPSTSEVLCTTSAEALAMGKFVILPSHPSNDFFAQFPNCLVYTTKDEFVANLYYAITHSPEPLAEEFAHALSWEAATERLEAAGCIPVEEAERMEKALASSQASIEISLPPLVEAEESRQTLARTLIYTRDRYRQFRSRLSSEIQQSKVLPKFLRDRLLSELDKRLDLDIEEMLASPKLRVKLSPAELDQSLLELYDKISESPSGDLLRLIGGGGSIAMQNLYMRRKAQKELQRGVMPELLPSLSNYETETNKETFSTPTQLVRWAMRKNLPNNRQAATSAAASKYKAAKSKSDESLRMSVFSFERPAPLTGFKLFSTFTAKKPLSMSLLI